MTKDQITEKVITIICDNLGLSTDEVTIDDKIEADLEADSLDMVEIIMAVEEEFNVEIPDEDAEKLSTPREIVDYVEPKIDKE